MGHFNGSGKSWCAVGSHCLGYQVQLGDAVNIKEASNVVVRERLYLTPFSIQYLLSCTGLSSYMDIDRIHETSEEIEPAEIRGSKS